MSERKSDVYIAVAFLAGSRLETRADESSDEVRRWAASMKSEGRTVFMSVARPDGTGEMIDWEAQS